MASDDHHLRPPTEDEEFWLFGYGSLIWKPPPHFDRRIPGYVTGYVRRFWQASEDHRGTPSSPGRVVTLIDTAHWSTLAHRDAHPAGPRVWGVAYRIEPARVAEVKAYLDIREINGYTIHYTPFHPSPSSPPVSSTATATTTTTAAAATIRTLVYIGTPSNQQFTGPQDPSALAAHIYRSEGPSGPNRDYLWGLERALAELGARDEHVSDLSERVRAIAKRKEEEEEEEEQQQLGKAAAGAGAGTGVQHHRGEFHKVTSVDESEETEKAL